MESETDSNSKKKVVLALCELLPIGGIAILQRLPQVIDLVLNMMIDDKSCSESKCVLFVSLDHIDISFHILIIV